MEFRNSFSKLKKKVKHRLEGSKPKPTKTGVDVGGSKVDPMGSLPGAEPHVVAGGGHDKEGSGANADGGQVLSTIRLPQPDELSSIPAHGSVNSQERRGARAEGNLMDGEKVERVDPSPPTASVLHDGKSDST